MAKDADPALENSGQFFPSSPSATVDLQHAMGCAGSASSKYDAAPKEAAGTEAEAASYPSGEWRVEESAEEWIPLDQEMPMKMHEIGQQLLRAYFDGQLEATYALPTGNFHVDFYQQLQTQQETGRQCRIAWFDTSAASAAGYTAGYAAANVEGSDAAGEELTSINPEVYLGLDTQWAVVKEWVQYPGKITCGEWLIEDAEGSWVRLDHEISAQLLVAWYCGEQLLDYSFQGASFQVDLTVWEQRNVETGEKKKIVWNSSDASSEGDAGLADSAEGKEDSSTWLDPGEEAERQLWAALNSGQQVVRYSVNGCQFEVDVVNMIQTNLSTGERWMIAVEDGPGAEVPEAGKSTGEPSTSNPLEDAVAAGGASEPRAVPTAKGGRPKAFIYKAVPDPGRPPPKQKKWSLAPGQKQRLAPKAAPKNRPAPNTGAGKSGAGGAKELPLPRNVEWPKGAKARRVAEAVYADMHKSREKPLAHRRRAYMAACLSSKGCDSVRGGNNYTNAWAVLVSFQEIAMTSLEAMDQEENEKVVDKLSKMKPNEWSSVLDGLFEGVSFRPVQGSVEPYSVEPYTVTSLLAKMSDEGASEPRKDAATGRRRKQGLEKRPIEKPQEDDRPLEDLLRDLGEIADDPGGPKQKKKGTKKAPPKQEAPAAEVVEVATAAKRRARVPEVSQVAETVEVDAQTEEEVTPAASEVAIEDGWQQVPTKQARRAAHKAAKEEREQREQRAAAAQREQESVQRDAVTAMETASKESESCNSESGFVAQTTKMVDAPSADAETTEAPSSVRSKQAADTEEAAVEAAVETAPTESTEAHAQVTASSATCGRRRSRSEGPPPLDKAEPEEVPEVNQAASPSSWQVQPSVGTWLLPSDGRQGSPVGQLWPATPESTPPTSPRRMSGNMAEVVWMPIPVHLAGEVQQLINASKRAVDGADDVQLLVTLGQSVKFHKLCRCEDVAECAKGFADQG
eukprot:s996_g35.t1